VSAKDIFQRLIERASCWSLLSSMRNKPGWGNGKPGELIEKLPPEEREELKNLSSEDVEDHADRHVLTYMIGQYPESTVTVHKLFPNKKDGDET
jgi:hypothetical protein